jgi:hypothetical protein
MSVARQRVAITEPMCTTSEPTGPVARFEPLRSGAFVVVGKVGGFPSRCRRPAVASGAAGPRPLGSTRDSVGGEGAVVASDIDTAVGDCGGGAYGAALGAAPQRCAGRCGNIRSAKSRSRSLYGASRRAGDWRLARQVNATVPVEHDLRSGQTRTGRARRRLTHDARRAASPARPTATSALPSKQPSIRDPHRCGRHANGVVTHPFPTTEQTRCSDAAEIYPRAWLVAGDRAHVGIPGQSGCRQGRAYDPYIEKRDDS